MEAPIKNYNEWLNEGLIDKIVSLFRVKVPEEVLAPKEEPIHTSAFIDYLHKQPKMYGIKMDSKVKDKIEEIDKYIDTLDDDDSREGWDAEVSLTSDLMREYSMGDGSSWDSLLAAWVRDNDNLSVEQQLFVLDTFLDQVKLIKDFARVFGHNYPVFKMWIVAHAKGKTLEQFANDSRGAIAGHKYGI